MNGLTPPSSAVIDLSSSGVLLAFAAGGVIVGSPYDRVVGGCGAGHVDGVDLGVVCQVAADVGATIKQAKPATRDELTEDVFVERSEVFVDRVHFYCADIAPDVQLVNDVQRCDGAEVARA